jgi:AcrR family transcriptional regulator
VSVDSAELSRRDEILDSAAEAFARSGVRTSLKEIADACGILPGSLYHHFESREAIVLELVQRYKNEIDQLAANPPEAANGESVSPQEQVVRFAEAIAACGVRNRGAVLLTLYEQPGGTDSIASSASIAPPNLVAAMAATLQRAKAAGGIRARLDLAGIAERLCSSMLHIGIGMFVGRPGDRKMPAITTNVLLDGLAVAPPTNAELDRSRARAAADAVIASWRIERTAADDRGSMLRAVARDEFGRRGYEGTTIRDIAASAGLSTGSVYRLVGSKEELLGAVMQSFAENITAGWEAVLGSDASAIEKLDALMWVNIKILDRFSEEFRIQLGWMLQLPSTVDAGWLFATRLRELETVLRHGVRSGEVQLPRGSLALCAQCVLELIWTPEALVRAGTRSALALGRDSVLRGAAVEV